MAVIKCPNAINEFAYGVEWKNGLANIKSQELIERLLSRGYVVVEAEKPKKPRKAKEA